MKYQLTVEQIDQVLRGVAAAVATSFIDNAPVHPHKPEWTIAASFDPIVIEIPDDFIDKSHKRWASAGDASVRPQHREADLVNRPGPCQVDDGEHLVIVAR